MLGHAIVRETYKVVILDEVVKGAAGEMGHRLTPVGRVGATTRRDVGWNGVTREVPNLNTALVPESGIDTTTGVVEASAVRVGGVTADTTAYDLSDQNVPGTSIAKTYHHKRYWHCSWCFRKFQIDHHHRR